MLAMGVMSLGVLLGWLASILLLNGATRPLDLWAMLYAQLVAYALLSIGLKTDHPEVMVLPALVAFPIIQVALIVASIAGMTSLTVWYSGDDDASAAVPFVGRLMGWATNPNQLGISLAALPFWLIYFRATLSGVLVRSVLVGSLAACLICGVLVNSNTVFLAWGVGGIAIFCKKSWSGLRQAPLLFPLVAGGIATLAILATDLVPSLIDKGQDSDLNGRLPIWIASLENWATSPLVGLGPGPHGSDGSGGDTAESHMLLLDLLTQGGILALVAMLYMYWTSIRSALKTGNSLVVSAVLSTFVEALAHNTQRHPMFWIYLILPMLIACLDKKRKFKSTNESAS
jgi:O-antigen ligase